MAVKFREKAKEKLNTADNLNLPVDHVPPHWWFAAAGGLLAATAFVMWAFLGKIPLITAGTGIYLQGKGEIFCFVPLDERSGIEEHMQVSFTEEGSSGAEVGGYIEEEEDFWNSGEKMLEYVNGNEVLLQYLTDGNPVVVYRCVLEEEAADSLKDGTVFQAEIHKESIHPVELWL